MGATDDSVAYDFDQHGAQAFLDDFKAKTKTTRDANELIENDFYAQWIAYLVRNKIDTITWGQLLQGLEILNNHVQAKLALRTVDLQGSLAVQQIPAKLKPTGKQHTHTQVKAFFKAYAESYAFFLPFVMLFSAAVLSISEKLTVENFFLVSLVSCAAAGLMLVFVRYIEKGVESPGSRYIADDLSADLQKGLQLNDFKLNAQQTPANKHAVKLQTAYAERMCLGVGRTLHNKAYNKEETLNNDSTLSTKAILVNRYQQMVLEMNADALIHGADYCTRAGLYSGIYSESDVYQAREGEINEMRDLAKPPKYGA